MLFILLKIYKTSTLAEQTDQMNTKYWLGVASYAVPVHRGKKFSFLILVYK